MFNLNPKENKFYKLFLEMAKNVNQAAMILKLSLDSLGDKEINVSRIEELEHKGDKLVRIIIKELNEAFITPIDREDIYSLINKMDDVIDLTNATIHRFVMFGINETTEACKLLAEMIVQSSMCIMEIMEEFNSLGNKSKHIREKIININKIENEADVLFRKTVSELFKNEPNPVEIIKWKEIYQKLEDTIDKCEKIANTIEGVVIKNA
jgi:uncharacterized protein Yka (UPF0111/DUF47 family)